MNPTPWQRTVVAALAGLLAFTVSVSAEAVFEQITYYHNDLTGSPIAATNSSGNVVWKEGYAPYGQRLKVQDGGSNEIWFHGKPSDSETGLSYFGARYYDPVIGRFMGFDPNGFDQDNVHSVNRYAYGNNNPYRYIDPNGRWPTEVKLVHQASIDRVLGFLPEHDRAILRQQQVTMDASQGNGVQFQHALRVPNQTRQEAWRLANDFARGNLQTARDLEAAGQHDDAMYYLGNAIHTMQDATSPAHRGFQEYDDNGSYFSKAEHARREFFDPGAGSELDRETSRGWQLFKSDKPLPGQILTPPTGQ